MLFGESVAEDDSSSLPISADESEMELELAPGGLQTIDILFRIPLEVRNHIAHEVAVITRQ